MLLKHNDALRFGLGKWVHGQVGGKWVHGQVGGKVGTPKHTLSVHVGASRLTKWAGRLTKQVSGQAGSGRLTKQVGWVSGQPGRLAQG